MLGWAVYGPAVDDRARLLCQVAVETAVEHSDEPGVIEAIQARATKDGLRTRLYMRRDRLYTRSDKAVRSLTGKLALSVSASSLVSAVLAELRPLGLAESDGSATERRKVATAAILAWLLKAVRGNPELTRQWAELVAGAALYAQAEGTTAAMALTAILQGHGPVDLDSLYDSILANLRQLDVYWSTTDSWVRDEIKGLAGDLGRQIAGLIELGASRKELEDAVASIIGTGDGAAFYLDAAIGTAYSQAAIQAYQLNNVTQIDWVTVGDANVCANCDALEDASPYPADSCPSPPGHGGCRCWTEPSE